MLLACLYCAIAANPWMAPAETRVDLVEVNHVHEVDGSKRFTQVVWWDLGTDGRHHVVAWRMVEQTRKPVRDRGRWVSTWWDASAGWVRVSALTRRESWTLHDAEADDRECVPVDERRGIITWRSKAAKRPSR